MTVARVVHIGCEGYIVVTAGGSVYYFVKGALSSPSKGCRLSSGVQEVIRNRPIVRRWASWFGLMTFLQTAMEHVLQVNDALSYAAAWGGANAIFSAHRGTRAAVREGLKGAAYTVVGGLAVGVLIVLLIPPETSD